MKQCQYERELRFLPRDPQETFTKSLSLLNMFKFQFQQL
jgi:hypothetical protein